MGMSDFVINKVHRKTLNQIVYESIKNSIINGEIKPGTKLAEVTVARQLSVSPTPVREAFRMLATEGLVRIEPWKGAVVQSVSDNEALDTTMCRSALERLALELWFERKTEQDIDRLEEIHRCFQQSDNEVDFLHWGAEFHNVWIHGSGNLRLVSLLESFNESMLHGRYITKPDNDHWPRSFAEHALLIDLIKQERLYDAKELLHKHILESHYETCK